jgi:acetylornithine deacetylase/succinyl-diaminopimelate desuccinylase-like protein
MDSPSPRAGDWRAVTDETVRHLQALLRLDTTNPPGHETLAAEYLAGVLRAEGIEPLVLESAPGRGNLVARLPGSGQEPPLLLYSHTDVVPAEASHWSHPPFGGEIAEGFVWGRGAVDMKDTVAQQLMVLLLLKRHGVSLRRDVIFAATADEEVGGHDGYGVAWLAKHHPDLLRAEFGLSEVGGYNMDLGGRPVYLIQVAEKGTCWIRVRAHGRPGHGSMPHGDNAVVHLARALARLDQQGLPYHLTPPAHGFLDALVRAGGADPLAGIARSLKQPVGAERAFQIELAAHPLRGLLFAMLHNTATPTVLAAGYKTNVIPGVAEATLDGRTLPGFDTESFLAELKPVLGEAFEYEIEQATPPIQARHDTPLFKLMAEALRAHDPQAGGVLPYMMSGATDAKYLVPLGVPTYGFAPVRLPRGLPFMEMFHAHDERVPVEGLGWGVQVLYDVVARYCATPGGA